MATDMKYYRLARRTDPTYGAVDAIKEWLYSNPRTSVKLAEEIWPEMDPDSFPMDWDVMEDYLKGMDPMDVFYAGYYSHPDCDSSDGHYVMDGCGHFSSMNESEYVRACVDFMRDNGYLSILDGTVSVPRELADVLALWGETVKSENVRPSGCRNGCKGCGECGSKPTGKKSASKNRKPTKASKNKKSTKASRNAKSTGTEAGTKSKSSKRCRA